MPLVIVKGISREKTAALAPRIAETVASIIAVPEEWIVVEHNEVAFFRGGKADARYCDPATVPCEIFEVGDEFLVDRESFFNLRFRKPFCSEAWNAISTYVFTMVQGGEPSWAVNHTILTCRNDGARPVVFKLERIDD